MGSIGFFTPPPPQQQMLRMMQQKQQFDNMMYKTHMNTARRSSQKREFSHPPQQQRVVINLQLNSEVQLHTTDQAWKPSKKSGGVSLGGSEVDGGDVVDGGTAATTMEEIETELLYKKTRSILNKLTPQNFVTLLDQLKEMKITTEDRLAGCIDLVFEKAISEPNFCEAYAKMAQDISSIKVQSKDKPGEVLSFRKLLLNRCQEAFELDRTDELDMMNRQKEIDECHVEEKRKAMVAERDDKLYKARRRSLGNIRFIGELFRIRMLTDKIMFECWFKLMKADDVDSLECLCWLVRTIGKDLDTPTNKSKIDAHFSEIERKARSRQMTLRTRFMLQDLVELRSSKWVPRRTDNNPKTIEQIHQEAHKEEQLRQASLTSSFPPPMQQQPQQHQQQLRHNRQNRGSDPNAGPGDDWTYCNNNSGGYNRHHIGKTPLDHSKLKLHKLAEAGFKLEPNRVNWTAGSNNNSVPNFHNLTSRNSSQESEKSVSSSNNRFSALLNQGSEQFDSPSNFNPRYNRWRNQNSGGGGGGFKQDLNNFNSLPRRKNSKEGGVMGRNSPRPSPNHSSSRESSMSRDRNSPHPRQHLPPQQMLHSQTPHLQQQQSHKAYHNYPPHPHHSQQQQHFQKHSSYPQFKTPSSSGSSSKSDMVFTRSIPPLPPNATNQFSDPTYNHHGPVVVVAGSGGSGGSSITNHSSSSYNNKISCLLEEYHNIRDIKEALLVMEELKLSGEGEGRFVADVIAYMVDKKFDHLISCGLLLAQLYHHKVLSLHAVRAGLEQAVIECHDVQIDVPLVLDHLSDVLSALLTHGSADLLPVVFGISQSSKNIASKSALKLVVETLFKTSLKMGMDMYMRVWMGEGSCSWWSVVAGSYSNFVKLYKVESLKPLACDILVQLKNHNNLNKWIREHTETDSNFFINNLMTAICFAAIKTDADSNHSLNAEVLSKHLGILKGWLGSVDREMVALNALQQLDHALEHPSSLLNSFFDKLHMNDVISDTCFLQWRNAPAREPGKGIAITSTTLFFNYLQESQEA